MKLDKNILKRMIQAVSETRSDEITCDECFEELNHFAEMELAGKSIGEALPLVKHHLDHCKDCHEEYEVLLSSLKEIY